ncbi:MULTISPECIES: hypothetical protein [Cyanophyceae]|jgi:hypothetical protein|nr:MULTISPECIES: hypothetical protein [Cyanophyceae]MCP9798897.1 hypothetical protein [Cyanobium sp. Lug-B]MCP9935218.1 hypothetical protein [Cyanobium sp. Candia 9D4]
MAKTLSRARVWVLASLLPLLLLTPAIALACDTGADSSPPAARTKKR